MIPPHQHLQSELAAQIESNFSLSPNSFTKFLEPHIDNPATTAILCHFLVDPITSMQTQLKIATTLNFIVETSFRRRQVNPQIWQSYFNTLCKKPDMPWKIVKVIEKSFKEIVESFREEFLPLLQEIYDQISFQHKIILQNILIVGQISTANKMEFIYRYLRRYLIEAKEAIHSLMENPASRSAPATEQQQKLTQCLQSIKETLILLKYCKSEDKGIQAIMDKIASSDEIMDLIQAALSNKGSSYISENEQISVKKVYNDLRSVALGILSLVAESYSQKCGSNDFDHFRVLAFMETSTPIIAEQLKIKPAKQLHLQCNELISMSMLNFIKTSTKFTQMGHRYFWENYYQLFHLAIFPLLQASDQECRLFDDDHSSFIKVAEYIAEGPDEDIDGDIDGENFESCKTQASVLLEEIIENVDGAMTRITNDVLTLMEAALGVESEDADTIIRTFGNKPSLEACLTILTILANKIRRRDDLSSRLQKLILSNTPQLLSLKDMDEVRFLISLSYCSDIFFINEAPPLPFYEWVANCLDRSQILAQSALIFFENCLALEMKETGYKQYSHSYLIWDRLNEQIETTKYIQSLEMVDKTLWSKFTELTVEKLIEVCARVINRINGEIRALTIDKNNTLWISKCLGIVRTVSKGLPQIKQRNRQDYMSLCACMWGVFDHMKQLPSADYADELLTVFTLIIESTDRQEISEGFFQFLKFFGEYHMKKKQLGYLFYTYPLLLQSSIIKDQGKGDREGEGKGEDYLQFIVDNVLMVMERATGQSSIEAILILQLIMLEFPNRLDHHMIAERTRYIFEAIDSSEMNQRNKKEKTAAIFNVWVTGSSFCPSYSLQEFGDCNFSIFYGHHSYILTQALKIKIISLSQTTKNMAEIIFLIRRSIEILKLICSGDNRRSLMQYQLQKIQLFRNIHPSECVKQAIKVCGVNLERNMYEEVLETIYGEVSRDQLLSLMKRVNLQKEQRVIFKIKQ